MDHPRLEGAAVPSPINPQAKPITPGQGRSTRIQALTLEVLDEPGSGGASHLYDIRGFNSASNPSDPFVARYGKPADHSTILFQNGPIKEVGANGITDEALIAILLDRLSAFQEGPYACEENAGALIALRQARAYLMNRTLRREAAGVEGTHRGC